MNTMLRGQVFKIFGAIAAKEGILAGVHTGTMLAEVIPVVARCILAC
jgi:hypothetical protein